MSFTPKRKDNKPETKTINKRVFRDLNIRGLPSSRPVIFSQAKGYVDKRPTNDRHSFNPIIKPTNTI